MKLLTIPEGHADDVVIVSVSGGKDSTATWLRLVESGIPHRAVFADTGWEAPETYAYLDLLREKVGPIDVVRSPLGGMLDIARKKAGFPTRMGRWCTEELKVKPLREYHDRVHAETDRDTISVVGIRADESETRAKMPVFEHSEQWGGYVWRPSLHLTVAEVIETHHRHGVPLNPLYLRGHSRVGCRICIFETKASLRLIADTDPETIDVVDAAELEFTAERARRNASGEGNFKHPRATFFMPKTPGEVLPIRDAVMWSRTDRGGRQLPLIQPPPSDGCFRWGMCEPPAKEEP